MSAVLSILCIFFFIFDAVSYIYQIVLGMERISNTTMCVCVCVCYNYMFLVRLHEVVEKAPKKTIWICYMHKNEGLKTWKRCT